ncbi:MAG: DUF2815 family protein, partial [Desulfobulbaceae bacterium]|nr:DUF2815 family protein [Desulfobulbaceae bacterium]
MANTLTPPGRLVQGNCFEPQTADSKGKPYTRRDGSPRVEYFVAVAFEKSDQAFKVILDKLIADANQVWAPMVPVWPRDARTPFSWKIRDGDAPENRDKEGFKGCWVLGPTNGFPIQVLGTNNMPIREGIKCGDYVQVVIDWTSNNTSKDPGMYVNLYAVKLIGYGPEIQQGPDFTQMFGDTPELPAGASATPTAEGMTPP